MEYKLRRNEGRGTITELVNWDRGQTASERLAGKILEMEGFENVDPSHPVGGPDGGKDFICEFHGRRWIGAVYFPYGDKNFFEVKKKFLNDLDGVSKNYAKGIAFITNQELSISQRKELENLAGEYDSRIYHLERIANLLDSPKMYGVRLEFLDIDMTKEEQLSFFNYMQEQQISKLASQISEIRDHIINKDKHDIFDESNEEIRTLQEVEKAENEFYEKIWLDRHFALEDYIEKQVEKIDSKLWKQAQEVAQKIIDKYGEENLGPYSDFEWGMMNGKLSALRWILGCEWDMLDT